MQINMQYNDQRVYDAIVKRFIAIFYEDCKVSNTVVIGKAAEVNFRTTGKEIISKGQKIDFKNTIALRPYVKRSLNINKKNKISKKNYKINDQI